VKILLILSMLTAVIWAAYYSVRSVHNCNAINAGRKASVSRTYALKTLLVTAAHTRLESAKHEDPALAKIDRHAAAVYLKLNSQVHQLNQVSCTS
jgi:hypothetical protein